MHISRTYPSVAGATQLIERDREISFVKNEIEKTGIDLLERFKTIAMSTSADTMDFIKQLSDLGVVDFAVLNMDLEKLDGEHKELNIVVDLSRDNLGILKERFDRAKNLELFTEPEMYQDPNLEYTLKHYEHPSWVAFERVSDKGTSGGLLVFPFTLPADDTIIHATEQHIQQLEAVKGRVENPWGDKKK